MSVHVLLNLLKSWGKGFAEHFNFFCNKFNKFKNTRARMLDYFFHMTLRLLLNLISAVIILSLCTFHLH